MVITALLIFFWAVVPGLITGWMLRERGRRFFPGLFLGAVCGPLGILGVLTFIYLSDRRRARGQGRGRAVRVFYDIPLVGRLHVSTVWALAGVATFLCLWIIGGITYEVYRAELNPSERPEQARRTTNESAQPKALLPANNSAGNQTPEARLAQPTQGSPSNQSRSALLGNFSEQARQPAPSENSDTNRQTPPQQAANAPPPAPVANANPSVPPQTDAQPTPQPPKAPAPSRADAVAEIKRDLAAQGHKVHAALSGDAQTATLSLSGVTLTREAGNQVLGGRLRGALKAAGVRIVVMMNGEQSWTYML